MSPMTVPIPKPEIIARDLVDDRLGNSSAQVAIHRPAKSLTPPGPLTLSIAEMVRMSEDFDLEILHRDGSYLIMARAFGVVVRTTDLQAGICGGSDPDWRGQRSLSTGEDKPQLSEEWIRRAQGRRQRA